MDLWVAVFLGLGVWVGQISYYFVFGKKKGDNFMDYFWKGALGGVIATLLYGTYLILTH